MKNNQILRLLTPSWVVNFFGIAIGVIATGAVIVLTKYESSALRFQIFDVQSRNIVDQQQGIYANITLEARDSSFLGALPLLITWACVGLLVYYFAMALAKSFGSAAAMREQMDYVNASRAGIKKQAFISLGIRLLATLGWFIFIKLSISFIVPYALASASAAATGFSLQTVGYAVMAVVVLYLDVVIHAIFLRLVLLRPRVFGN